ncbi:MAG: hypothetical protein AABZ60_14025, partial [Planctomycetota bacterium]
ENTNLLGVLKNNIDFNAIKGKTKILDQKWKDLIDHFNQPRFVLINENFEFPDLLGAAYEYLIKFFADSAGKKVENSILLRKSFDCWFNSPSLKLVILSMIPPLAPVDF